MNVLLIYPNITDYPIDISYGLAAISSFIKQSGHQVNLLDYTFKKSHTDVEKIIQVYSPDIIGIPVASNDFHYAVDICSHIKSFSYVPIVAGGFHTTLAPEDVLNEDCFDIAIIGEGENSFLEVIEALKSDDFYGQLHNILGIWFRENGIIFRNGLRQLNQNISELPFPDRSLFNYQKYIETNRGLANFISSFGCPFNCSYCINKALIQKYGYKGFVRYKSVDYLLNEIKAVLKKFKVRQIEFYDDTFTTNKQRVIEFCERYVNEIKVPFYINSRVDTVNKELLLQLKKAGCVRVSMGIETGDNFVRNKVLLRNQTDDQIIEAFRYAKEAGLQTLSYNMVGIPYETKESISKTVILNRKCRPDFIAVSIFNAYKGTELYEICRREGWLNEERGLSYFQTSNIRHPNFNLPELKKIRDSLGYQVFKECSQKRAFIDLIDKKMLRNRTYQKFRSYFIKHGIKKYL